jgi:4-alpha-glucanotransferase
MTDPALLALAEEAGVVPRWRDVHGTLHQVSPETLRAILRTLGFPAGSDAQIAESIGRLHEERATLPPLITAAAGEEIQLPGHWLVQFETGDTIECTDVVRIDVPGYHRLEGRKRDAILAVAPARCHPLPHDRAWGIAAQLYSLRRKGDGGIGDFTALAEFVRAAAARGADAVAISPVHALFAADPHRFSPYAPSSRIMLNVLHADAPYGNAALEALDLVDWPAAARIRLEQFRQIFDGGAHAEEFAAFRTAMGAPLEAHARFEALHAHFFGADPAYWHWRTWPERYRDPSGEAVAAFARMHEREVTFHAYLQFLAHRGLAAAQAAARAAGMRVGLIADLAVGIDSGGSQAWSRQAETLLGLSVGAPPDLLNTRGQDWGLCTFSPYGLRRHGYTAFLEMLRSALRHAGGVRIDHAMGLQRLWVIPEGASAKDGAYLSFPFTDLLRLVQLESQRHQAIVLAEDLGTVPEGFSDRIGAAGVYGMRVLWFEQDNGDYRPPQRWSPQATAMTTTHDLPTVAGWWRGRDIEWRHRIGLAENIEAARAGRAQERAALWRAFRASGATDREEPPPEQGEAAADAACAHVARTACALALLPLEDVLACIEQPNLPSSTQDEHPNWRRRLPGPAAHLLDAPGPAARLAAVAAARRGR